MLFRLPENEVLYAALIARDESYEGRAWVGVVSTGIFCRLSCPAPNPKPKNCAFYDSGVACLEAGFRPCKRCKPLSKGADTRHLLVLEFFERKALPAELKAVQKAAKGRIGVGRFSPIEQIEREMGEYFAGTRADFETPIAPLGTPFTRTVWDALRAIPVAETRSYGEVAAAIGRPTATRAVARANGGNPIAIVVPCHRVIGADGSLTGYGGGLWRKRWLIAHEAETARKTTV